MRKEIHKEETYNCYVEAEMKVKIGELGDHRSCIRALRKDVPKDDMCINGRLVYTIKHKPMQGGHAKTDAYTDNRRMIDARFSEWKARREAIGGIRIPQHYSYGV